jgi:hypothetical protein
MLFARESFFFPATAFFLVPNHGFFPCSTASFFVSQSTVLLLVSINTFFLRTNRFSLWYPFRDSPAGANATKGEKRNGYPHHGYARTARLRNKCRVAASHLFRYLKYPRVCASPLLKAPKARHSLAPTARSGKVKCMMVARRRRHTGSHLFRCLKYPRVCASALPKAPKARHSLAPTVRSGYGKSMMVSPGGRDTKGATHRISSLSVT